MPFPLCVPGLVEFRQGLLAWELRTKISEVVRIYYSVCEYLLLSRLSFEFFACSGHCHVVTSVSVTVAHELIFPGLGRLGATWDCQCCSSPVVSTPFVHIRMLSLAA